VPWTLLIAHPDTLIGEASLPRGADGDPGQFQKFVIELTVASYYRPQVHDAWYPDAIAR
jgi:hypothetical protein